MVNMKLGKKAARKDPRALQFGNYLGSLPPPPGVSDWLSGVLDWGVMRNNDLGNCTCAGLGHAWQTWSAATGPIDTPTDKEIVNLYEKACGYVPGDEFSDQGGVEVDVLNYVRKNTLGGRRLIAYADPSPQNVEHIKQSIYLFAGVYIGLLLPVSAQEQDIWDVAGHLSEPENLPGSWGGHAVFVPYYDEAGLVCITWGAPKRMTWAFWKSYCDEAHTLLSEVWLDRAPAAFRMTNLLTDLHQVVG